MQAIILTVLATVALASAGGIQGSYQSQYVQHSHAVVAHAAPVVQTLHATPVVHAVHSAPIVRVAHAAPVVHAVHAAPIVRVAPVALPTFYKTVVPTSYASSYSYRAPAAKILKTVVHQPIVYAAPRPVYQTAAIVPSAYASAYNYRAPIATVHHTPVYTRAVHHAVPVVHAAPFAVHHATPVVHAAPFAVHHPIAHASPFAVHHAGSVLVH